MVGDNESNRAERRPIHPLTERLEAIEHDLTEYNKKIDKLEDALLRTCRYLAAHDIEQLRMGLHDWLAANESASTGVVVKTHDFLVEESALAQQAAATSATPLKAAAGFRDKCERYFKSHKLQAFRE